MVAKRAWKNHRLELSMACAKATKEAGLRRLTGTAVHWKPQPHLRPLNEGAHVKAHVLDGQKAAQMRVDGRYAILIDWRGESCSLLPAPCSLLLAARYLLPSAESQPGANLLWLTTTCCR